MFSSRFAHFLAAILLALLGACAADSATAPTTTTMTWQGWFCLAVVICVIIGLFFDLLSCTAMMFSTTLLLMVATIIGPTSFLSGLSNTGVITIAHLFIVVDPISQLPLIKKAVRYVLESGGYSNIYFIRMKLCVMAAILSAVGNQNPIVVMLTPIVKQYCREKDISPTQLLMPMAFASAFGGSWTVIGTSVNLVYDGLMVSAHLGHMPFFELIKTTAIPTVVGIVYLTFVPSLVLSHNTGGMFRLVREKSNSFLAQFIVKDSSTLIGKTVADFKQLMPGSLRKEVELIELARHDDSAVYAPPRPEDTFQANDLVVFSGPVATLKTYAKILHLEWVPNEGNPQAPAEENEGGNHEPAEAPTAIQPRSSQPGTPACEGTPSHPANQSFGLRRRGMSTHESHSFAIAAGGHVPQANKDTAAPKGTPVVVIHDLTNASFGHAGAVEMQAVSNVAIHSETPEFLEVVLGFRSPTVGTTVGSTSFRTRYSASILAVRPVDGAKVLTSSALLNGYVLQTGDTLLVYGAPGFATTFDREFSIVSHATQEEEQSTKDIAKHYVLVPSWFPFGTVMDESALAGAKTENAGGHGSGPVITAGMKAIRIPRHYRYLSLLIFVTMIVFTIAGWDIFTTSAIAVVATVGFKILTVREAVNAIELNVMIQIAYSFGLGAAMSQSSLAGVIGNGLASADVVGFKLHILIAAVATVVTNAITNKACAQVLFPIVISIMKHAGEDPMPAIMVLCAVSSWAFTKSYGKPTNLIIMGPGGYSGKDYAKLGLILNIIMIPLVAACASLVYNKW